ncbi:MAG: amidohydrolase [Acidobacteria bacterium]|nr:MAG: amidohydrolase [Acidobacteriota bacterium]REJ98041.1 MAG: amidohydrolase [Acidobacteriota bacterium]REK16784.1 MAG: amidohydrolase [Acidobacteriota bacterium]REK42695.1 MAG: amidohydrolase [Acidobacteriota bacterium]
MKRLAHGTFVLLAIFALILSGCENTASTVDDPADLVLLNGKIVTVDEKETEAQALAVKGDKIVAVGTDEEIQKYVGPETEKIDLEGRLAIPGFNEGHGHFMGIGNAKMILDLTTPKNWDEIVAMVGEAAKKAKPGEWITGRGWHQDKWDKKPEPAVEGLPVHDKLSEVSPDNPVILTHASGHGSFANAKAMELANIDSSTKDPAGGEILRDAEGNPTGFVRETAQGLVSSANIGPATDEERDANMREAAELAAKEVLENGITTFHDAGSSYGVVEFLRKLVDEGKMPVRLWMMIRDSNENHEKNLASTRVIGHGNNMLTVRAIKLSIDGALGSRGAWLLEPYSDAPELSGLNLIPIESAKKTAELAVANDYQLCIHAIGDRANREVLDIFEEAYKANEDKKDLRWRIEHAQHLHPDDIPRFGKLGVIASMQGVHCTSDGTWVPDRLGDKRSEEGAYVWQKLMQSGALVTNGTDAPVEDVSPIASYYSTVSRKLNDGSVFYPDQKMSRMEALRSYTINVAKSGFEEEIKGSLEPGKLADIVVLSKDILTVPEDEIPSTEVLYTIVGGKIAYRKQ